MARRRRTWRLGGGVVVAVLIICRGACGAQATVPAAQWPPALDSFLPASVNQIYSTIDARFDAAAALDTVRFMDRFWRVAANAGFLASQDRIRQHLTAAGFQPAADATANAPAQGRTWFEEFADPDAHGWDHTRGTLSIVGDGDALEEVLSRERHRVALCINSFSTPRAGLVARLVDVGAGSTDAAYAQDVRGTVVIGDAPVERLWQEAVRKRGALGVISTDLPAYVTRGDPNNKEPDAQDVLQWGSIPYDEARKSFGFKATRRAAEQLRSRLRHGLTRVKVEVDATFSQAPNRTLLAEIPGTSRAQERLVLVAHVQEPGANDDGSGCATLEALAIALSRAMRDGAIARPARTLTFLWVDEIRGSRQWLRDHAAAVAGVQYMFSLDMTGEETTTTGGTFLIEKQPDPSAVWPRPSDPHTEWGASDVDPRSLKGSLLNDLLFAICQRRARETGWAVRTNPYEGGSDHTTFNQAGVPSILAWHFTDRFYHTNLDRPDVTSAAEMKHVGVSVGTAAMLLASADAAAATSVARLVDAAGTARLAMETHQSVAILARTPGVESQRREAAVIAAWRQWYGQALESVLRLPVRGPTAELKADVAERAARMLKPNPGE